MEEAVENFNGPLWSNATFIANPIFGLGICAGTLCSLIKILYVWCRIIYKNIYSIEKFKFVLFLGNNRRTYETSLFPNREFKEKLRILKNSLKLGVFILFILIIFLLIWYCLYRYHKNSIVILYFVFVKESFALFETLINFFCI